MSNASKNLQNKGYIFLFRSALENNDIRMNKNFSEFEMWVWMITEANYTEKERNIKVNQFGRKRLICPRGSLVHSYRYMGKKAGWSPNKVMRFVKKLEEKGMVSVKSLNVKEISMINILNYDDYQHMFSKEKTERFQNGTTTSKNGTTTPKNGTTTLDRAEHLHPWEIEHLNYINNNNLRDDSEQRALSKRNNHSSKTEQPPSKTEQPPTKSDTKPNKNTYNTNIIYSTSGEVPLTKKEVLSLNSNQQAILTSYKMSTENRVYPSDIDICKRLLRHSYLAQILKAVKYFSEHNLDAFQKEGLSYIIQPIENGKFGRKQGVKFQPKSKKGKYDHLINEIS